MLRRLPALAAVLAASGAAGALASAAAGSAPPIQECAFGAGVPGLQGYYAPAVERAAEGYAAGLSGADGATRAEARRVFAAAAAAYGYGFPQVVERETVKHFLPHDEILSVAALADPSVQTVVSPNADTAYTVAWLDLVGGPVVVNVPDTDGRYYTFQFLDAFTNDFAYVGSGSTGTRAGAYALVPPGWQGTLPAGVTRIDAPSYTVWLLGRTLVRDPADLPAVKRLQEQYEATPLAQWEEGVRQPPVVLDRYPPTVPKSIPSGAQFIAELNRDMEIDPPSPADRCALQALAPAGVEVPHPTPAQRLLDDASDEAPPLPAIAGDPVAKAAIDAGIAAGARIVAGGATALNAASRRQNNGWEVLGGWVGRFGTRYLARSIVATDLLAANTPKQAIYPLADTSADGAALDGAHRYTITFPKGGLPPVNAFWSLTMYNASHFLYSNQINRYEISDRTQGLHFGRDGSLTLYLQHDPPSTAAQRANWLPAPSGSFNLALRLFLPKPAALSGAWKPPPVLRSGERVAPALSRLRISPDRFAPASRGGVTAGRGDRRAGARVSYRDSDTTVTHFEILSVRRRRGCRRAARSRPPRRCTVTRVVVRFLHHDRAGANRLFITGRAHGRRLRRGRYILRAVAGGTRRLRRGRAISQAFYIR